MLPLDDLPVPVIRLDDQGAILYINHLALDLFGIELQHGHLGKLFSSVVNIGDKDDFNTFLSQLTPKTPTQTKIEIAANSFLIKANSAEDSTIVLVVEPLDQKDTEALLHERAYQSNRDQFKRHQIFQNAVLENISDGIVACDDQGKICMINKAARKLYMGDEHQAPPTTLTTIEHFTRLGEIAIPLSKDPLSRTLEGKKLQNYEVEFADCDSTRRTLRINGQLMKDHRDETLGAVISLHDITDLRETKKRLHHLAYHDVLTNLPNRRLFHDLLEQTLKQSQRQEVKVGVLFLDIDNFKNLNDRFGHPAGDKLLQEVGKSLKNCLRDSDILCRWGGDEFVVGLPTSKDIAGIRRVAEKIRLALLNCIVNCCSVDTSLSVSIGAAISPDHGSEPDLLIRNADVAMYEAKRAGKNRCEIFSPATTDKPAKAPSFDQITSLSST